MLRRLALAVALACPCAASAAPPLLAPDHLATNTPPPAGPKAFTDAQPVDRAYPLPQDAAVAGRLRADRVAWLRKRTLDVFDAHGNTKAAWADAARAAMDAYCVAYARRASLQRGAYHREFVRKVKAAVAAGCDDALVKYWHVRHVAGVAGSGAEVPAAEYTARFRDAHAAVAASKYPAGMKVHVQWNARNQFAGYLKRPGAPEVTGIGPGVADHWPDFRELAKDPGRHAREEACEFAEVMLGGVPGPDFDRPKEYVRVAQALTEADAPEWTQHVVRGEFLINWAWDVRGGGFGADVPAEDHAKFRELLGGAQKALESAWKLDPSSARPAVGMITVSTGLGLPRDEMEEWFRRAMAADPDCAEACWAKANYLQPKWHGTPEDATAFARQCLRTGNHYARLPEAGQLPVPPAVEATADEVAAYAGGPNVWPGTRLCFEGLIARYPTDLNARAEYAFAAVRARKWDVAAAQFAAVGDSPDPWTFGDLAKWKAMKRTVDRKAGKTPGGK